MASEHDPFYAYLDKLQHSCEHGHRTEPGSAGFRCISCVCAAYRADRERLKVVEEQRDGLAHFNPNWDMLAATQQSLREHMQLLGTACAERDAARRERDEHKAHAKMFARAADTEKAEAAHWRQQHTDVLTGLERLEQKWRTEAKKWGGSVGRHTAVAMIGCANELGRLCPTPDATRKQE